MSPYDIKRHFQSYLAKSYLKNNVAIDFFYGNESVTETIVKFSTADIVFGFHGAGSVNVLFSPKSTLLVIEATVFTNPNEEGIWRSNAGAIKNLKTDMRWVVYCDKLPAEELPPDDKNRLYYQFIKYVDLSVMDISNIVNLITTNLLIIHSTFKTITS